MSNDALEAAVGAILEAQSDEHVKAEKIGITVRQLIGILKEQDPHRVVVLAQKEFDRGDFRIIDHVDERYYDYQTDDIGEGVEDGFCTGEEPHCAPALVIYPDNGMAR